MSEDTIEVVNTEFIVPITPLTRPIETLYLGDADLARFTSNPLPNRHHGTFLGVFVPTCEFAWSVLLFIRFGFIAGEAGVIGSILLILLCSITTFVTCSSVFALATNGLPQGGMYKILSQTLGKGVGGTQNICVNF
jgi:amino acid transporter